VIRLFAASAAVLACVLAQTPPSAPQPNGSGADTPTFQSTTRLVQVNVVVHGKDRKPVEGLTKGDFTVLEKGKPQRIAFFNVVKSNQRATRNVQLPQNVFSNRFGDKASAPASVTVILLDSLNTKWEDQAYARQQVVKFLQQIQPGDRVAIYSLGRGLQILHDYTTDSAALIERLNRWKGANLPDLEASAVNRDDPLIQALSDDGLAAEQRMANFFARNKVLNTLTALESIGEHLASVPGRKSLIWVSGGFPLMIGFDDMETALEKAESAMQDRETFFDELEKTLRALNHGDVAIYPVDARGLMVNPQFSASTRGSTAPLKPWTPPYLDTMNVLADRTGGKAFYNRNDLDRAIREVFDDTALTYTLGYYSDRPELDGKFRELKVRVNRPGVNVRARKGYFALADMRTDDEKTIKAEMKTAVWSPLDGTAVAVNARVDKLQDGSKASVLVQIDPSTTTLVQNGDRWAGRVDIAMVFKAEDARQLAGITDTLQLSLTKETYLKVLKSGIIYRKQMDVPAASRSLRIVVRDAPSGLSGSLTVPMTQVAVFVPPPPASGKKPEAAQPPAALQNQ
jgi:VWFA-related protein